MIRAFVLAVLLGLGSAATAAADLQGVGTEVPVGPNGTGEACRMRVVQDEAGRGSQRLNIHCDGWSVPSGVLLRFRVSRDFTPERILTDSTFQRAYETRLGGCGAVAGGRGLALETFPTNVRLLEAALAVQSGTTSRLESGPF